MKGTTVGPYRVLDRIGGGGMGVVHEAEDTRLGRRVALKFLPPELTADPNALSRFRREARAASALNHPHICTVHDIAEDDGHMFLVMERLEGSSLKDALPPQGLPLARVLDVGVQSADALDAAHAKGIVHRDIKPSNLWLTTRGDVKVLDFGLAKRTRAPEANGDTATEDRDVTSVGAAVGTLGYMSPEQARGEEVDGRSDLFSLGAVLYELAIGKAAFPGKTTAVVLDAILNREPADPAGQKPTLPAGFGAIVSKALEKDRALRYQTASDLKADLLRLKRSLEPRGASGAVDRSTREPRRWLARRRIARWFIGGSVVVGLAVSAWLLRTPPMPRITNVRPVRLDLGWFGDASSQISSSWTTDGVRLYYVKKKENEYGLFQVSITGGEPAEIEIPPRLRRGLEIHGFLPRQSALLCLTLPDPSDAAWPVWVVPVPRGTPRRLGDLVAGSAAVSPDGTRIVIAQPRVRRLLLAHSDGSDARTLVDTHTAPVFVRWDPGGKTIRFMSNGPPGHDGEDWIWETTVEGAVPRPLYQGRRGDWTPDGRHFAFERSTESASRSDVFVVGERPGPPWPRHEPIQLTSGPLSFAHVGARPDGQGWFAFGADRRGELLRFDHRLGKWAPHLGGVSVGFVDPSPDGEWRAWVSFPDEVLWQGRRDGSTAIPLTSPPLRAWMPRWSPDGKRIAFVSRAPGDAGRTLRVVPAGGGEVEVWARPEKGLSIWDPCWLPDGRSVVFGSLSQFPVAHLWELDWAERRVSVLPATVSLNYPKCGPQGQLLATKDPPAGSFVVRWPNRQEWEAIPPAPDVLVYPTWTRDGQSFCGLGRSDHRIHCYSFKDRRYTSLADAGQTRLLPWVGVPWMGLDLDDSPMVMRDVSSMDLYALDWEAP